MIDEPEGYTAKWKCQLYIKIVQKIKQAIQRHPKKRDLKADFKTDKFEKDSIPSFSIRPKFKPSLSGG